MLKYIDNFEHLRNQYLTENLDSVELPLQKSRLGSIIYCDKFWEYGKYPDFPMLDYPEYAIFNFN